MSHRTELWDKMFILFRLGSLGGQVLEETQGWETAFWSMKLSGSIVK
jgi:hypothetical protein